MKNRSIVFITIVTFVAGLAAGYFAFSIYWQNYNSSLISQTYSNLERYSAALSACESTAGQCNEKFVALLRTGYIESLTLTTGIYVISQDDSYQFAACNAIKSVKSSSVDVVAVQSDSNKYLRCKRGI